jgi:hypothetical protein
MTYHITPAFSRYRVQVHGPNQLSHPTPNLILTYHTFHVTHITSLALKYFNVALKLTYHFMSNHHTRYRVQVHGSNHLPLILTYRITQTSHYVQSSALLTYRTTFHVTHITMLSLSNHDDIPHHTSNLIMTYHRTFHVTHVTMLSRCNGAILTFCSS